MHLSYTKAICHLFHYINLCLVLYFPLSSPFLIYRYYIMYFIKNKCNINPKLEVVNYKLIIYLIKAGFEIGYATKEFILDELDNKSLYEIKIDNNISKRIIVIATIDKREPNYSS